MDKNVDEKFYYDIDFEFHGEDKKVATLSLKGHDILKRVNSKYFKCPTLTSCRGGNVQKRFMITTGVENLHQMNIENYKQFQTGIRWKLQIHTYIICGDGWTIEVINIYLVAYLNSNIKRRFHWLIFLIIL